MRKNVILTVVIVGFLWSCDFKKKEVALQSQVDSLKSELVVSQQISETMQEVGLMIDSIDASRDLLKTNLVEGLRYDTYVSRLRDIDSYVKASKDKMADLEKALKKSGSKYTATISRLKKDLEARGLEVAQLTEQLANYKGENDKLVTTVALQGAELADKTEQLTARQQEVSTLQEEVRQVTTQAKFDLADSYYQRALAVEETARRTKLAPRKKKSTKKEALELYKLAALSGKTEAEAKIKELEKDI